MSNQEVVYKFEIEITKKEIKEIVEEINNHIIDEDEELPLTVKEVLSKPKLLEYLITDLGWKEYVLLDQYEFISNDGWNSVGDYR